MTSKIDFSKFTCKIPQGGEKVFKEECVYCFESAKSENGLYICLATFIGVCKAHLSLHIEITSNTLFINIQMIENQVEEESSDKPPTKLAIGVEGGFDVEKEKKTYTEHHSLVNVSLNADGIYFEETALPNPSLPLNVQLSIAGILSHKGAEHVENVKAWEEKRIVSKHADNLQQIENGIKIPPSGWKCSRCDLTQNLWLNLTDGTILCGRRYYDGSGGNNHAVEYYEETKYPLAVKLGTITAAGGDVYSYDEDDMVIDPKLKQHLKHFGIDIELLEKTDKTMTELEIEANLSIKAEWDLIQEAGKKLQPMFGPGFTGLINLGNSCYINSVMQVFFSTNEFQQIFVENKDNIFRSSGNEPWKNFNTQMAKLADGLLSGKYSKQPESDEIEPVGIRPSMIKSLIGHGHVEFSTNAQQDAHEYFLHVIDMLSKSEKSLPAKLTELFQFQLEDRIECMSSHKVRYSKHDEACIGLQIPLEMATNQNEYTEFLNKKKQNEGKEIPSSEVVRLNIPSDFVMANFFADENIDDFYSSEVKSKTTGKRSTRFATFPEYLVIQLRKFTIGDDWVPKKFDVSVDMPDELDLTSYRSTGLQPNEQLLPDDEESDAKQEVEINESFVMQLVEMGFPLEACKKAVYYTNNQGVEPAMNWVFEHSQDADFASPLQLANSSKKSDEVNEEAVAMIVSMGFSAEQAKKALKKNNNNLEAAAEWIFSHMDELNEMEVEETTESQNTFKDGIGKYSLFAFISHMGTSTSCGHYVCHIKKGDRWIIYNDRKVAVSETPPKNLGYLYFYKRKSN